MQSKDQDIPPAPPESPAQVSSAGTKLVGAPFIGTTTSIEGRVRGLTISVILGTSVGEVVGTIVTDGRTGRDGHRYQFKGAMTARGLFVWHASTDDGRRAVFTGTVGPDGNSLGGKFMAQETGHALETGTFLASRR